MRVTVWEYEPPGVVVEGAALKMTVVATALTGAVFDAKTLAVELMPLSFESAALVPTICTPYLPEPAVIVSPVFALVKTLPFEVRKSPFVMMVDW